MLLTTERQFLLPSDTVMALSNPSGSKFKDDRGIWLTRALFWETRVKAIDPMFTLKDHDHHGLPSLKNIYFSYDHVPGYEYLFATEVLGGWQHWEKIAASSGVGEFIKEWRAEMDILLKAKAMQSIIKTAYNETPSGLQAAKYLSDKGWLPNSVRGRPSKEEKARALAEETQMRDEFADDLERLGLRSIKGGKSE